MQMPMYMNQSVVADPYQQQMMSLGGGAQWYIPQPYSIVDPIVVAQQQQQQ